MKINEVTNDFIKEYINAPFEEDRIIEVLKATALHTIVNYTGLKIKDELQTKEDLTIAYLSIICQLYDNRSFTSDTGKTALNPVAESILNMHSVNLL
jgi:hypothetical protein